MAAGAIEIGSAYLTIGASTDGIMKSVGKTFANVEGLAATSGKKIGQSLQNGIGSVSAGSVKKLQEEVTANEEKLAAASERAASAQRKANESVEASLQRVANAQANAELASQKVASAEQSLSNTRVSAAKRVEAAELALQELKDSGSAKSSQIAVAEAKVADARAAGAKTIASAENSVQQAKNASVRATQAVENAENNVANARRKADSVAVDQRNNIESYNASLADSKRRLGEAQTALESTSSVTSVVKDNFSRLGEAVQSAFKGDFKGAFTSIKGDAQASATGVKTEFEQASETSSTGMETKFSGVLAKFPALIAGAGIGAAFSKAMDEGLQQGKMQSRLTAQLNLTGPQAATAGKAAGELFTHGYGESMAQVYDSTSAVIGSIKGMANASQSDIEKVTGYALNLSDAFGIDVSESVGSVGVMINNGLVKDASQGFDLITGAMQQVPEAFRGEMTDALTEYSKHFAGLGISGQDAVGMLVKASQNGEIGIDKMGDAVKEFQIRSTDMSKNTVGAYDAIGLNAEDMTGKLLQGGETAQDAFGQIIHGLQGMDDPTAQSQAALALFGTQLEDLGVDQIPNFLGTLDPAGDSFDSLAGAAENMGNTLQDNAATKVESFKRAIGQDFVNVAVVAIDIMSGIKDAVAPIGQFLGDTAQYWGPFATGIGLVAGAWGIWNAALVVYDVLAAAAAAETGILAGAIGLLTSPITFVIVGLGLLVGAVIYAYKNIGWFHDGVVAAWDGIKVAIGAVANWFVSTIWPAMQTAIQAVGNFFVWLWQNAVVPAWNAIGQAIGAVVNWFTGTAWPFLKNVLTALGAAFVWLNESVIQPVWLAIRVATAMTVAVLMTIFDGLVWLFKNTLGPVFVWFYQSVVQPVWNGISAAISWAWNNIIKPVFSAIVGTFQGSLAPVFTWFWSSIVQPVWNAISNVISWAWNSVIKPVWAALKWYIDTILAPVFQWLWSGVIQPVWNAISNVISWAWNSVIKPVWAALKWYIDNVLVPGFQWLGNFIHDIWVNVIGPAIKWAWDRIIKPVWDGIKWFINNVLVPSFQWLSDRVGKIWGDISSSISGAWDWIKQNVLNPMGDFLQKNVVDFFRKTKQGISNIWDGLKDVVKKPVEFVVNTVIRDGIIGNYNKIADKFNVPKVDASAIKLPDGWARGGVLPGYQSAKRDDVLTPMRSGEGVLVPEAVRGLGAGFVHAANDAGNKGGVNAVRRWASQGFAKGGIVSPLHGKYPLTQGWNPVHKGIDIGTPEGTPIYAPTDGRITWAGPGVRAGGVWGGNEIHLMSGDVEQWFAHLSRIAVRVGERVKQNQLLGATGNTGITSGPHLHYGTFRGGWPNAINSSDFLQGALQIGADAGGGSGGGWLNPLSWLVNSLKGKFTEKFKSPGAMGDLAWGMGEKAIQSAVDFVDLHAPIDAMVSGTQSVVAGGKKVYEGVANRTKVAAWMTEALRISGDFTPGNLASGIRRAMQESGGNPNIQNNWDSNAAAGIPSKGLMQVVGPTFAANAWPGHGNILDPVDNILASIKYTKRRYGSLQAGWDKAGGYATGGIVTPTLFDGGGKLDRGVQFIDHQRKRPDYVLTESQWNDMHSIATSQQQGGITFNGDIQGYTAEEVGDQILRQQRERELLYI